MAVAIIIAAVYFVTGVALVYGLGRAGRSEND